MKLPEFRAKEIFKQFDIPIPRSSLARSPSDASRIARELGKPVVIKAQVLSGSRGKTGGILFAQDPEEAKNQTRKLLNSKICGIKVKSVLVEERLQICKELYLGVTIDKLQRKPVVIASSRGGVDIEEVTERSPDRIYMLHVDPVYGLQEYQARYIIGKIGLKTKQYLRAIKILINLYQIFKTFDAELTEINPLVVTEKNGVIAADARLNVDDASLFRHPKLKTILNLSELSSLELKARQGGFSYVELDGNIGIVGNGAGLVMATLDLIEFYGGFSANFCDVGGGANANTLEKAANLVLSNPKIKVLLINILAGITRCDEIALGLIKVKKVVQVPIVVRLVGTNEEEGKRICEDAGINVLNDMDAAVKMVVKLSKGG